MDKRPLFTDNLERFDAAYEAILNAKWEVSGRLMEELIASYDDRASKKLLRIYTHVEVPAGTVLDLACLEGPLNDPTSNIDVRAGTFWIRVCAAGECPLIHTHSLRHFIEIRNRDDAFCSAMLAYKKDQF